MDLRQVFAANLRRLRQDKSISQEDLPYSAWVNRSYLSTLEKGAAYPGLQIIGKLADVFSALAVQGSLLGTPEGLNHQGTKTRRVGFRARSALCFSLVPLCLGGLSFLSGASVVRSAAAA